MIRRSDRAVVLSQSTYPAHIGSIPEIPGKDKRGGISCSTHIHGDKGHMTIESAVTLCTQQIEQKHNVREQALRISRILIRQSATTIRAAHRGEFAHAAQLLHDAQLLAQQLRECVADHADILVAGYTQDALKEYTEAVLVYAFLTNGPIPSHLDLHVDPAAYLNGMAEAASELRRAILDRLRRDAIDESEVLLTMMDEVCGLLMTVDYPDAITGGLRRSTDALRGVLERTRGDLMTTQCQQQLLIALRGIGDLGDAHE